MGLFALLGFLAWAVLTVFIFRKAGYSGLQTLLLFIPVVNVVVYVWFALTEWPVQRELNRLRSAQTGTTTFRAG